MAEVARWTEASLKPEHYKETTFSSRVDEELSNRIRALLVARKGQNPPRAPCPSPDLAYSGHDPDGSYAGYKPITRKSSSLSVAKTIAKLTVRESQEPVTGNPKYDGPASRTDDFHSNGYRLSQPDISQDAILKREGARNPKASSELNDISQAGLACMRSDSLTSQSTSDSPSRPMSLWSKKSTGSRLPAYNLRTVPPHISRQAQAPMNHGFPHVPGNYQSETEASTPRGFQTPPAVDETTQPQLESKPQIYSRALQALASLKGHDNFDNAQSTKSSLRREPSTATLASSISTLPFCHSPSDLFVGQSQLSVVAEPIVTAEFGEGRRYSKGLGHRTISDRKTQLMTLDAHVKSMSVDGNGNEASNHVPPSGPTVSESLPTMHQTTECNVDDLESRNPSGNPGLPLPTNDRRTTVVYSPKVIDSSYVDPSSILNRSTDLSDGQKAQAPILDTGNVPGRDADTPSVTAQRLPSLNRVLSEESVMSTHAGLQMPSSRSSTQREDGSAVWSSTQLGEDSSVDQVRSQKNLSLPSVGNSQLSFDIADDVRLIKQPNTPDHMDSGPKRHWIRALLTPRATTSSQQNQSNLTARPTRMNRGPLESEHTVLNVTKEPNQLNSESTEEKRISVQEQKTTASFAKVIQDLETLLKEALFIARQGADSRGSKSGPSVKGTPVSSRSLPSTDHSDCSSLSAGTDEEGHYTDFATDMAPRQERHFVKNRDASLYPGRSVVPTRHPSNEPVSKMANVGLKKVDSLSSIEIDPAPAHPSQISREVARSPDQSVQLVRQRSSSGFCHVKDWAFTKQPLQADKHPSMPRQPGRLQAPLKEQTVFILREYDANGNSGRPLIQPRTSSAGLRSMPRNAPQRSPNLPSSNEGGEDDFEMGAMQTSGRQYRTVTQHTLASRSGIPPREPSFTPSRVNSVEEATSSPHDPDTKDSGQGSMTKGYSLKNRRHFSVREGNTFSLSRSHRRAPIARDWSTSRKRYVATVTCVSTAMMGLIIGIYAGEVPAIQYAIVDEHHYSILGNVVFFLGLAITTALLWPLPLLHGRKPYTTAALALMLPLQFPQALAVGKPRSPYIATYRVGLLLSRAASGLIMGFASINFKTTLLDLFGASLQSANPHQETVNKNDVRRHGGGMGVWLGIWTWCSIGSIGTGFSIGAVIISGLDVDWGFWIVIILAAFILILNVLVPEVRRSAYRRSMAEVRNGREVSRRIARGEIKMHIDSTGPIWWGEELAAGYTLCVRMLKQPGFLVLSLYVGWIYGQVVMLIVLLGALMSKYYRFHPQYVGLCVGAIPLGALLAIPFQKASLFSRSRKQAPRTDSMTVRERITWTSHLIRRAFFMIALPFAGLAYTLASGGSHVHFMIPTAFAGLIGFLSNLAIAECNGLIMETYDTSDLQPGMTGRPRRAIPEEIRQKITNYSCFPRVTAAFAITQTFAFMIAAAATGWGGVVERRLGAQTATAVVAGVLLVLTILLMGVLWRFKEVQIIPSERFGTNILTGPENEWKPIIIGNPSGTTRRMSLLELGKQSRWSEIRRRNKLVEF